MYKDGAGGNWKITLGLVAVLIFYNCQPEYAAQLKICR